MKMLNQEQQETILLSLVGAFEENGIDLQDPDYLLLTQHVDTDLTDISFAILGVLANHGYNKTNNKNMSFATGLKITGDFLNALVKLGLKGVDHENGNSTFNFRTIFDNWLCIQQQATSANGIQC